MRITQSIPKKERRAPKRLTGEHPEITLVTWGEGGGLKGEEKMVTRGGLNLKILIVTTVLVNQPCQNNSA